MSSGSGIVSDPNTVVIYNIRVLLNNLKEIKRRQHEEKREKKKGKEKGKQKKKIEKIKIIKKKKKSKSLKTECELDQNLVLFSLLSIGHGYQ